MTSRSSAYCAVLALAYASTAHASESAPKERDPGSPADIIVTANKRPEPSILVPATIASVSGAELDQAHARDLFDVTTMIPSFRVDQQQASAQTNFLIRGFGNGDNNVGIEPSVGVFIDGVYRSRSAAQISDLVDVSQIDVLAGPQTTLFGKNASAGVISISTEQPSSRMGGNASITYGNYNAAILKGSITGPLTSTLSARLSGSFDRDDGYARNLSTNTTINNRNRWSIKGQLLWAPTSDLTVRLIADADRLNESCCAVVNLQPSSATGLIQAIGGQVNTPAEGRRDLFYSNFNPTNDIRNSGVSGQIEFTTGRFKITSITAWRTTNGATNQDADFTSADLLSEYSQQQRIRTFTQELRVGSDFQGPFNFVAGAYLFNENIRQSNTMRWGSQMRNYADGLIQGLSAQLGAPTTLAEVEGTISALSAQDLTGVFFGPGQGQFQEYRLQNNSFSAFIQGDFKATDRLTFTAGANITNDTKHYGVIVASNDVFSNLDLPGIANGAIGAGVPADQAIGLLALAPLQLLPSSPTVPNSVEDGRTANTRATWTARAAYKATDSLTAYANLSTGFKPSSINLSRDSRPSVSDAAAMVAAGLSPAPTVDVAGLQISTGAYGGRSSRPETSTLLEAGIKGRWKTVSLNVSVFREVVKDFQTVVFTGTGFFLQNAGKQTNWGVESNASIEAFKGFTVSGAVAWYNPHYDKFENSSVGDLTGTRPANIAPVSLTLRGQYELPLANGNTIRARASWHYESPTKIIEGLPAETVRDPITQQVISYQPSIDTADAYKREVNQIDASISFAWRGNVEFSGWVRNLTNDRYLIGVIDSPAQSGSISGYYNRPRTYGASASVKW